LKKAYAFAAKAHEGQKRSSGEDYIIHPINVAATLIKLHMDMDTIISGLLHDVVEDCDITPETIEKEFGTSVAALVVGRITGREFSKNGCGHGQRYSCDFCKTF
jgi:GTP pyrophosphokinase